MSGFECKAHRIRMTETIKNGRPYRTYHYDGQTMPHCTLLHMTDPKPIQTGEQWHNPVTGRSAYSTCTIEEV